MTELWSQDDHLVDVTSAFQGFTQPLNEIVDDIHRRGWTVGKIDIKDEQYIAEGKNPHGEKLEATGRTDATAAANLLVKIMRKEHMRASAARQKLGAWDHNPIEQQMPVIAQAYAGAPVYEPKAAPAWMDLAQDCARRAQTIRMQLAIEYTHDPTPYESADDMREDVTKKRHILVTRAFAHHPVWSEQQMLDFRLVVDVLGHAIGGGDWGWHGTCLAFASLAPMLAESPQKALFTELLGQAAFGQFYRQWGPQKICFLEDLIEKEQEKENKPGHTGVHPSQSIVPTAMPSIFGKVASGFTARMWHGSGQSRLGPLRPGFFATTHKPEAEAFGYSALNDRANIHPVTVNLRNPRHYWGGREPHAELPPWLSLDEARPELEAGGHDGAVIQFPEDMRDPSDPYPERQWAYVLDPGAVQMGHTSAVVGTPADPNADWESGVSPLQDNAYLWQRQDGVDPLGSEDLSESVRALEPGLTRLHPQMAKQAVVNALRNALLGSRTNRRAQAIHYQDLMGIPADVDDPMAYHDALEQQREHWNQAQGYAPGSHKQHWPEEQQFKQWVKAANPHLDDGEVNRQAKREMLHMLMEEEERILAQDQGEQLPAEVVEHEAYEALKARLKGLTKPTVDQKVDFGEGHLWHQAQTAPRYFHSTEAALTPGDIIRPASEGYDSYSTGMPGYDPNYVYVFDQRHFQNPDADPVYPNALPHTYEVEPLAPIEQDPEGTQLRERYEARHGHPFTTLYHPEDGTKPVVEGCPECLRDTQGIPEGPEWYHPYNWRTTQARVIGPADWDDPDLRPHTAKTATHHADMYPPFIASRARPIAQVSRHANALAEAAKEDLQTHKGHGHHFRSTALSLGIPGLGPRQTSHAWLHLAPQTSQLAIINPEVAESLGHDYATDTTNRDYFKHERELAAGRDAAGYSHVPLGAFGTGLYDLYAGGSGWHPNREAFKAHSPIPHHSVDWMANEASYPGWTDPYWWQSTQEARDQAAQDFDRTVGVNFGRDEIPFQKTADASGAAFSTEIPLPSRTPWLIHPETGERLSGPPGTSLMQHVKDTLGHPDVQSVWARDYQVGKGSAGPGTIAKVAVAKDIGDYITTKDGYTFEVVDMSENPHVPTGVEYVVRSDLDGNDCARSEGQEGVDWQYVHIPTDEAT